MRFIIKTLSLLYVKYTTLSYDCIKYDADLVHCLLQYVLGILHQLLHLSEHVVKADRTPLQGVLQDHRPAPRHAAGRPQAQAKRNREQHCTGHLSFSLSSSSSLMSVCSGAVWRTEGAQPHTAGFVLFGKSEEGLWWGCKLERIRFNGMEKVQNAFREVSDKIKQTVIRRFFF